MYNRYMPQGEFESASPQQQGSGSQSSPLGSLFGGGLPKLDGIWKALHLDRFDKGDILLILVLVFLFMESDDEDWLIVLALVVLMGL